MSEDWKSNCPSLYRWRITFPKVGSRRWRRNLYRYAKKNPSFSERWARHAGDVMADLVTREYKLFPELPIPFRLPHHDPGEDIIVEMPRKKP